MRYDHTALLIDLIKLRGSGEHGRALSLVLASMVF
jgi:hypothetical protein